MNERYRFGIFAKYWAPGKVKTRLAKGIGDEKAAAVYLAFLRALTKRYSTPDSTIVFSPDEKESEFRKLVGDSSGFDFMPQGSGDLGARMQRLFESSFADGFDRVVLIGSDTPTLPVEFVRQAFKQLDTNDVVLGPTDDGGYYLVGAKDGVPPIFTNISWSTVDVWNQTVARLKEKNLPFCELPKWYDVDDAEDLRRLMSELRGADESALRNELGQILGSEFE